MSCYPLFYYDHVELLPGTCIVMISVQLSLLKLHNFFLSVFVLVFIAYMLILIIIDEAAMLNLCYTTVLQNMSNYALDVSQLCLCSNLSLHLVNFTTNLHPRCSQNVEFSGAGLPKLKPFAYFALSEGFM